VIAALDPGPVALVVVIALAIGVALGRVAERIGGPRE